MQAKITCNIMLKRYPTIGTKDKAMFIMPKTNPTHNAIIILIISTIITSNMFSLNTLKLSFKEPITDSPHTTID